MQAPLCRICRVQPGTWCRPHSPLISPCKCAGEHQYVHRHCLDAVRIAEPYPDALTKCNVCGFTYKIDLVPQAGENPWLRTAMCAWYIIYALSSAVVLGQVPVLLCMLLTGTIDQGLANGALLKRLGSGRFSQLTGYYLFSLGVGHAVALVVACLCYSTARCWWTDTIDFCYCCVRQDPRAPNAGYMSARLFDWGTPDAPAVQSGGSDIDPCCYGAACAESSRSFDGGELIALVMLTFVVVILAVACMAMLIGFGLVAARVFKHCHHIAIRRLHVSEQRVQCLSLASPEYCTPLLEAQY